MAKVGYLQVWKRDENGKVVMKGSYHAIAYSHKLDLDNIYFISTTSEGKLAVYLSGGSIRLEGDRLWVGYQ